MIRNLFICVLVAGWYTVAAQESFVNGKVKGEWPYLEYGLGTDRLGGAKIGYLDTGVVVRVIDSTLSNYLVRLSKNHVAYLDRNFFKKDTSIVARPYYLTGSWIVEGNDRYDSITIQLDEKLPYRTFHQINPSRVVIDIFGVTNNTNWLNQRTTAREVKNVYYEQIEDDVFRVVIELRNPQHWGHTIYYSGKKMVVRIKRQPVELDLDKLRIAVDAGHGGGNQGASGVTSRISEKNYTLMIAKELKRELADKGAKVFMTRETDVSLGMNERLEILREEDPDLMVSIHLNSSARDSIRGVSTYYRHTGFRPLSQFILARMVQGGLVEFGNVGSFNFTLNSPTEYPNCLIEVAFLSNREDEKLILDPKFHKEVAEQIVEGIRDWLKYCKDQSAGGKASP